MRIDDENKVVWCSEWLIARIVLSNFENKNCLGKVKILSELTLSDYVPESDDEKMWKKIIDAIFDDYSFKLEQPQKYYWRKKKEHVCSFENLEETYLNHFVFKEVPSYIKEISLGIKESNLTTGYETKFTTQEARDLLKDDFDKFEKVECE